MTLYLVLTPPGAARDDAKARFIADRFTWLAFALPAVWLLFQRQWLAGLAVGVLQAGITVFFSAPGAGLAGFLVELSLRLLVGLEGPVFVARRLEAKGWTLRAAIPADDMTTAEMIYDQAAEDEDNAPAPGQTLSGFGRPAAAAPTAAAPGFGLFASYGER